MAGSTRAITNSSGIKGESIRVATLNARGLNDKSKRISVAQWFKKSSIDILCLQETFCTAKFEKTFNESFNAHAEEIRHCFTDSVHSRGTAIIFRKGLSITINNITRKENGRQIIANVKIGDKLITVVNIYAPNNLNDRITFFKRVSTWIKQNIDETNTLIICGDFNSVISNVDRTSGKVEKCGTHFEKLIKNINLVDSYRMLNTQDIGYTWVDPADATRKSRLDYIFVTQFLKHNLKKSVVNYAPVPDHKAVITDIVLRESIRGPGYWKLNTSILKDQQYKESIINIINKTLYEYNEIQSKRILWDLCKIRIKEYSIQYCIQKASQQNDILHGLNEKLNKLDDMISKDPMNINLLLSERTHIKNELNKIYLNEAKGYQIRSRVQWFEEGEKNTKYFANLENRRQTNNSIQRLYKNGNNMEKAETDIEILNETRSFYEKLFKSKHPEVGEIKQYLNNITLRNILSEHDKQMCDEAINEKECETVLRYMKDNKSPGIDGIPVEFYKTFWSYISHFLIEVYNESLHEGELSYSQRTAVISLIFKKGDRMLLKNYRPISLSTADYKILAFVLASRLQKVLDKLISTSQGGYIKKRFIGSNIRLIEDLIDYADKLNENSMIFFLDFEKAFDSVEWNFIYETLQKFNFGHVFINWIKTIYANASARIKNNGWLSQDIRIERGIRQGCPVSALLFIFVIEILALDIKANKDIKGIEVGTGERKTEIKISQYADDAHVLLQDKNSLANTIHMIQTFSQVAGPKLNLEKCEILPLLMETVSDVNVNCVKNARCLGIWVGKDKKINDERNWLEKIEKLKTSLHIWKTRNLTLFGKITVIKMLALPKITYSATNTITPLRVVESLNTILYDFLWQGRDRVKRRKTVGHISDGGISMIDVQSFFTSLKASWVIRFIQSIHNNVDDHQWCTLMKRHIDKFGKNNIILHMTFRNEDEFPTLSTIPTFYKQVIIAFNGAKHPLKPDSEHDVLHSMIWGNRHLTYTRKGNKITTLYSKEWIDNNIIFVKDILIIEGRISVEYIYEKLKNKGNIFTDITQLNVALKPYKHLITNNVPGQIIFALPLMPTFKHKVDTHKIKSNFIYKELIKDVFEVPSFINFFGDNTDNTQIPKVQTIFESKIIEVKENKLKQFNYKILNKICANGKLLSKWNNQFTNTCDECSEIESQEHIVIHCPQTQIIWNTLSNKLNIQFNQYKIIFGMKGNAVANNLISQIAYSIHKYWLIRKNDGKPYNVNELKKLIKQDLMYKEQFFNIVNLQNIGRIYALAVTCL